MFSKRVLKTLFFSFFLLAINTVYAQDKVVTGKVTDEKGSPLNGASVIAKGNKEGVKTDATGSFSITVPPSTTTLEISFLGHQSQQVNITGKSVVDVSLTIMIGSLDSVVVVGYTTQKRKDVTGSVSSISGKDIKNLPTTNVAEALQGRMAGVEVVKSSAEPGKGAQITIRGVSSLNQPDPLYVIDGVQQSGNNVNPQDIATIDVLKDAAAAAIYGAAAAGGVIIITTKRGAGSKPTVNFNARYGVTTPRILELLEKDEFIQYKKLLNDPAYANTEQDILDAYPNTDWVDVLYDNGTEENYNLSISASTPTLNYYISGFYNNQQGIFVDNYSKQAGFRINTDIKLGNRIKIGEQLNIWQKNSAPVKINVLSTPFRTVPTAFPTTDDPENPWGGNPGGYNAPNYYAAIKTVNWLNKVYNIEGNAYLEAKLPVKYLTFKATFGYVYNSGQDNINRQGYRTNTGGFDQNLLFRGLFDFQQFLNAYVLAWDQKYGNHTINLLGVYEQYSYTTSSLSASANNVLGSSYGYIFSSESEKNFDGRYDPNGLKKSLVGRFNYNYDNKYFATISVRRDGDFTKFGPENKYGIFPAISVGWKLTEERFISEALPSVNSLKLRASYGELGNSNIPPYGYTVLVVPVGYQNFAPGAPGELGKTVETIPNPNVKWESLNETNIGLDGELMNGKMFFSLDWYDKKTTDMLYNVPVSPSNGIYSEQITTNIGSVRNRGFEVLMGYKSKIKEVNFSISVNTSFNKNKVLTLEEYASVIRPIQANNDYPDYGGGIWGSQSLTYTSVGLPFGQFYGYKALGIFQTDEEASKEPAQASKAHAGDLHFWDKDGNGVLNDDDKVVLGSPYPSISYGTTINLNWKKFDLVMLWNGVGGVSIYNGVDPYAKSDFDGGNVTSKVFNASFFNGNGLTDQPRVAWDNGFGGVVLDADLNRNYRTPSSYFVENGSYFKLKNIQLGYTFSGKTLSKAKIKNARVYLMANNLLIFTSYSGVDPEVGGDVYTRGLDVVNRYPNARLYSVGFDVTF